MVAVWRCLAKPAAKQRMNDLRHKQNTERSMTSHTIAHAATRWTNSAHVVVVVVIVVVVVVLVLVTVVLVPVTVVVVVVEVVVVVVVAVVVVVVVVVVNVVIVVFVTVVVVPVVVVVVVVTVVVVVVVNVAEVDGEVVAVVETLVVSVVVGVMLLSHCPATQVHLPVTSHAVHVVPSTRSCAKQPPSSPAQAPTVHSESRPEQSTATPKLQLPRPNATTHRDEPDSKHTSLSQSRPSQGSGSVVDGVEVRVDVAVVVVVGGCAS